MALKVLEKSLNFTAEKVYEPCGVLEITTIFERDSNNQTFLNGDVLLNGS